MRSQHLRRCDSLDSKRFSCTLTSYGTIIRSLSCSRSLARSLARSLSLSLSLSDPIIRCETGYRERAREREKQKRFSFTLSSA